MRCEIPHRCVRRKYRIRRHSPFRLRNCWEGRSVRASSLLRQNSSSVPLSLGRTRPCKTTASPVCWKGSLPATRFLRVLSQPSVPALYARAQTLRSPAATRTSAGDSTLHQALCPAHRSCCTTRELRIGKQKLRARSKTYTGGVITASLPSVRGERLTDANVNKNAPQRRWAHRFFRITAFAMPLQ